MRQPPRDGDPPQKDFVACMLKEIALEVERRKQRQAQQRARALSTVCSGVGCCPDYPQCADCDGDEEAVRGRGARRWPWRCDGRCEG